MKPEELMIGDWVLMKNKPYKVASLSITGNPELESDKYIFHCLKDEIVPIPLTPEILEKNGWSNISYDKELDYFNDEIEAVGLYKGFDGNRWWWHAGIELVTPINYVHELQHALRLCGIDKEIKL